MKYTVYDGKRFVGGVDAGSMGEAESLAVKAHGENVTVIGPVNETPLVWPLIVFCTVVGGMAFLKACAV